MARKFSTLFIRFLVITMILGFCYSTKYLIKDHRQKISLLIDLTSATAKDELDWLKKYVQDDDISQNFQRLLDFTCAIAKDELEKHPEMRTIAMIELESNFPSDFSAKVLKCLPADVAKIIINPHTHTNYNNTLNLPKETLVIYIADEVDKEETFFFWRILFENNFPVVSHLSKHLIVSSDETKINRTEGIFKGLLNVVQIYEKNQKVIAKSFDRTKNFETFESSQRENLSQILFPDKAKNLNGQEIFAVWDENEDAFPYEGSDRPNNKWIPYLDIIAEKLNATLKFTEFIQKGPNKTSWEAYWESKGKLTEELIKNGELDFYLNYDIGKHDLESYNKADWCFLAPLPKPFSITELILFLPMDKSCWMWLGITIAVSTLLWRVSEGHWNFPFGFFSYFMGQGQLVIRIRTNRLTMKILLQLLIFAIFIFSNGYQSIVTSFMLDPMQQKLLTSIDELFDGDLKIENDRSFELLYGSNPKYQKAEQDNRFVDNTVVKGNWTEEMIERNLALSQPCKMNKMRIENWGDGKSWEGFYVIDEVVETLPEDLFTRPFHPYLENFQEIMDRSLEAGLHQAWERFFWEIYREVNRERRKPDEEKEILDFGLIAPSLYILAFGLPAALLALFCEIFWKDFVMNLTMEYFERKWKEIFGKEIKVQKRKPKVRRIQVKPAVRRRNSL